MALSGNYGYYGRIALPQMKGGYARSLAAGAIASEAL